MSTVTTDDAQYGPVSSATPSWAVGGDEVNDRPLKRAWVDASRQWWGTSSYLIRVFGRTPSVRHTTWSLLGVSVVLASASLLLILASIGQSPIFLMAGLATGLAGYGLFWRWVARNRHLSRATWLLERVRRCLACEGDPGPRRSATL